MTEIEQIVSRYVDAKDYVIDAGYTDEIDWQSSLEFRKLNETDFLRESAWVILNSGMRETVVRDRFIQISRAFMDWESSELIIDNLFECKASALEAFNNTQKINAIVAISSRLVLEGFNKIHSYINHYGIDYLNTFDFIGPATKYHLAKNLGLNVAKPDRHLSRIATSLGFDTAQNLCEQISNLTGDSVPTIDLIIWRFATLNNAYVNWFSTNIKS